MFRGCVPDKKYVCREPPDVPVTFYADFTRSRFPAEDPSGYTSVMSNLAWKLPPLQAGNSASGHVKGTVIRAHIEWVRDYTSREEMIELFETLPVETRRQVSNLLPSAWYEFATLMTVDATIVALFGGGEASFLEQIGAFQARCSLGATRGLLRVDDVHHFLGRAAEQQRQLQDFGAAAYRELSSLAGEMRHTGHLVPNALYCAAIRGFYRESVTLHGAGAAEVTETQCQCDGAPACSFVIAWR
jgi:hypothetical protein